MASNMYYSNNITQSPATNIPTSENYGNDNFYTQNYESGTNNYSSNIYTGETPQYYDQYYPDNNKNMLYKMKLKPKYNTNSINVNALFFILFLTILLYLSITHFHLFFHSILQKQKSD